MSSVVAIKKNVITKIEGSQIFLNLLQHNEGIFVLKIGASWCKPCRTIKPVVDAFFASSPQNVICADIDIQDKANQEVYTAIKNRMRLQGIPCLLMYRKGNKDIVADEIVTGVEPSSLHYFFKRCGQNLKDIKSKDIKSKEMNESTKKVSSVNAAEY